MSDDLTPDVVMARRFELVDEIAAVAARQKAELAPLNEELEMCESFIKGFMLTARAQNYKTDAGHMAFFVDKDTCTVKDMDQVIHTILAAAPPPEWWVDGTAQWEALVNHFHQRGLWMLLTKAVNKTSVKEILNTTKAPVAGVEFSSYRGLNWSKGKG